MGIASLICGVITLVMAVFSASGLGALGIILGLVGIIFGALGRKDPEQKSMATAGLIVSIVGLLINAVLFVACIACIGAIGPGAAAAGAAA